MPGIYIQYKKILRTTSNTRTTSFYSSSAASPGLRFNLL